MGHVMIRFCLPMLSLVLVVSCRGKTSGEGCQVNERIKQTYSYHYNFIVNSYKGKGIGLSYEQVLSVNYLEELTGIKTNLIYSEVVLIEDHSEFEKDLVDWNLWYLKNKCRISLNRSDSIDLILKESLLNYKNEQSPIRIKN